jgi:hypothetical protein
MSPIAPVQGAGAAKSAGQANHWMRAKLLQRLHYVREAEGRAFDSASFMLDATFAHVGGSW